MESEYQALRLEIIERLRANSHMLTYTLTAAAGLLGVGITSHSPLVILIYPIIATCLAVHWMHNDSRITDLGVYIRVRLEPELGLAWEHNLRRIQNKRSHLRKAASVWYRIWHKLCVRNWIQPTRIPALGIFVATEAIALVLAFVDLAKVGLPTMLLGIIDLCLLLVTVMICVRGGGGTRD